MKDLRNALRLAAIPTLIASLCCLSPVSLVLLGLGTVSFAAGLSDILYGQYKWIFRGAGLLLLLGSLIVYLRRTRGICTLDEAKKGRSEIINLAVLTITVGVIGYIIFLYVIVHWAGVFLKIWK